MNGSEARNHLAHCFFRERRCQVVCAQAGFDVSHWNAFEKSGEAPRERGNGIALHDDKIGTLGEQYRTQIGQNARSQAVEVLIVMHYGKIVVRADAEKIQDLVKQFPVLASNADSQIEMGRLPRSLDDGRHLDCFRASAKDK